MTALTLKHPWPYAVAAGGKPIENRTWPPPAPAVGRWHGLHGGVDPRGRARDEAAAALAELISRGLVPPVSLERAIRPDMVGVWRLAGVVGPDDDLADDPWFGGPFGWHFPEVVVFKEPIPCKGAQGLWLVPEDVVAEMRRRWAEVKGGAS